MVTSVVCSHQPTMTLVFVQLTPLEMNTEIFDAGDHGVEKKQEQ
jgi:hypothetical protein